MAKENQGRPNAGAHTADQGQKQSPPLSTVTNPTISRPCTQSETCYTQNPAPENLRPEWRRPEWVGVYVAVISAIIAAIYSIITGMMWWTIKRQADIMEKQASDARDSAAESAATALGTVKALETQALSLRRHTTWLKAAARNLENSERAWVQVEITKPPAVHTGVSGEIDFLIWPTIKNYGKTPAHIIMITFRPHQIVRVEDSPEPPMLPTNPEYVCPQTVWSKRQGLLPPSMGIEPSPIPISMSEFKAIRENRFALYVYGRVFYEDHTGQGRESRFCYLYLSAEKNGFRPEMFITPANAPDSYFSYT